MAKDNAKKNNNKNKKHFWKDFKAELKKVIWPTPKQLFKNTVAVIFIVLATAAIVFVLDVAFDALNKYGINKLKSTVKESISIENTLDEEEITDSEEDSIEADPEAETEAEVESNGEIEE